jgi:DNA-binding NtrC family response regulator
VNLRGESGLDAIRPALQMAPQMRVAMITTFYDPHAERDARKAGAFGFILKADLPGALQDLMQTPKEPARPEPEAGLAGSAAKRGYKLERLNMLKHLFSSLRRPVERRQCA